MSTATLNAEAFAASHAPAAARHGSPAVDSHAAPRDLTAHGYAIRSASAGSRAASAAAAIPGGIHVRGLSVSYDGVPALRDVSFDIEPGHLCGLVGMNGAGKSTLFKTLMGVVRPDAGSVQLAGIDGRQARKRGMVSYVPQQEDIDCSFPLRVEDAVMMGRYGLLNWLRSPRREDREAVRAAIGRVELGEFSRRQIGNLSGGQRKRVFVARGLAQRARIMLLDEPFAGVDRRSELMIAKVLKDLARDGMTILVASHDLHALPELCDEAMLINRAIVAHGPIAEVLQPEQLAKAFGLEPEDQALSEDLMR